MHITHIQTCTLEATLWYHLCSARQKAMLYLALNKETLLFCSSIPILLHIKAEVWKKVLDNVNRFFY